MCSQDDFKTKNICLSVCVNDRLIIYSQNITYKKCLKTKFYLKAI